MEPTPRQSIEIALRGGHGGRVPFTMYNGKSPRDYAAILFMIQDACYEPDYEPFVMGITEDIPAHRWRDSCRAIMDGLDRHADQNPKLYA